MKKFIYMAVAAIAALSSCASDDAIMNEGGQNETGVTTFTATMEGNNATRATYNSTARTAEWEASIDKINVGGAEYTAQTTGATTTFIGTGATKGDDDKYHAYFPASLYSGGTLTLPATQTYTADKFNMPMYAESTTTELTFKNLCAVLAVKVTSADITTLKSIKVKSDKALSGAFTVSENKAVLTDASDNNNTVVLNSETPLTLDETGTTFYIAIPAQEYAYLNIYLSADGTTYTQAMATKKAAGLGAIARNKMYSIDYEKNAVKLWEGNVFVADRNVGATSETDFGGYYTWGGTYANGAGIPWNGTFNSNTDNLTSANDAATKAWGSNWRIPTADELKNLTNEIQITTGTDNCTIEWKTDYNGSGKNGVLFTGKASNYNTNSVFLPAAGICYDNWQDEGTGMVENIDNIGRYRSSTHFGSGGNVYRLNMYLNRSELGVQDSDCCEDGYSVRAVLAE